MHQCLMKVPYVDLGAQHAPIKEELLSAVGRVLDRGRFILGEEVREFESRFAELCGVQYAAGLNSGTDALILALKGLGIGPGDEVITVANSFISSVSSIVCVGAKPVFTDVGEDYLIDPNLIEKAITPKTKALLPVHLTGVPANMDAIMAIAQKHKLIVIEDCAQAVTAEYHGQKVGSFGDVGCFSLHPLKTLNACGDGGIMVTNNKSLYENILALRDNGLHQHDDCIVWSNNSRLDTLQAAMLLVKLDYLDQWTEERRATARFYQEHLKGIPEVQLPLEEEGVRAVYHTFIIQAERRNELHSFLAEQGVTTKIHYDPPIHLEPVARELGYGMGSLPVTERQAAKVLSLPVSGQLSKEMLEYTVNCIHNFY